MDSTMIPLTMVPVVGGALLVMIASGVCLVLGITFGRRSDCGQA
jgi:hypothetical protein